MLNDLRQLGPSLGFVLLVGDTDFCPIHTGSGGGDSQVTDNWYACLDGPDYLPDLAISRISTRTAEQTTDVVDKLLTYERATFASASWIPRAGFGTSRSVEARARSCSSSRRSVCPGSAALDKFNAAHR